MAHDLVKRLREIKAERGFLLPHHGLLAVAAPELLDAYAVTYRTMTLTERALTPFQKEFLWLGILIATDEAEATHHLAKYEKAGGSRDGVEVAARMAALIRGNQAYRFVSEAWAAHLPGWSSRKSQTQARESIASEYGWDSSLMILLDAALRVCLSQREELAWAIEDAYDAGVDEDLLADALILTLFPASVPYFVRASGVWLDLIRAGRVKASPRYEAWASVSGQGGYDEASGKTRGSHGS
jgi:alkylhydroperoxidase/carboxymuconolactone decarboxylase family protein YurZ